MWEKSRSLSKSSCLTSSMSASVLFFVLSGCWLLYTANRGRKHEYRDVHESSGTNWSRNWRNESGARSAQAEIKNAEVHVKRADETAGSLQNELNETQKNLTNASTSLIECQNALKESRASLQTLEKQIQGNGAQQRKSCVDNVMDMRCCLRCPSEQQSPGGDPYI